MGDKDIRLQVHRQLIESGEYDRLSTLLKSRLEQQGWYNEISEIAKDTVKNSSSFDQLVGDLEPKGLALVPDEIRQEILEDLEKFLSTIIVQ